jgi:hypothetical protein
MSSWIIRRHRSPDGFCSRAISGYRVTEVGHAAATDRRPNKLRSKMTELLDVLTRTYEYQRAQPAFWGGTMRGIKTAQLALDGKLPTRCSRHEPLHYHRGCECTVASSPKIAEHGLRFLRLRPAGVCFRGGVLPNSDRSASVVSKRKQKIPVLWRSSL